MSTFGSWPTPITSELDATGQLAPRVLVSGSDFVSDPRLSPDGGRLCWLQWSHPDMPWDGTELCVADLRATDTGPLVSHAAAVAGRPDAGPGGTGAGESVSEPRCADDCSLWFISDRSDWWNLYRWVPGSDNVEAIVTADTEIGGPQWVFGQSSYAFLSEGRIVFASARDGLGFLVIRLVGGSVVDLDVPYTSFASIQAEGDRVVFVGASAVTEPAVVSVTVDAEGAVTASEILRPPRDLRLAQDWFSKPESISFPTSGGRTAHALFYPPTNPDMTAEPGELPPLLVLIHGGPTSAARPMQALAFRNTFAAGASHYGVADLEALATETHKFESRYLDGLIGPYPARRDRYVERSPIHHVDGFDRPLIVLQGLEDEVVPPNQAEMIVDALRTKSVPTPSTSHLCRCRICDRRLRDRRRRPRTQSPKA